MDDGQMERPTDKRGSWNNYLDRCMKIAMISNDQQRSATISNDQQRSATISNDQQ